MRAHKMDTMSVVSISSLADPQAGPGVSATESAARPGLGEVPARRDPGLGASRRGGFSAVMATAMGTGEGCSRPGTRSEPVLGSHGLWRGLLSTRAVSMCIVLLAGGAIVRVNLSQSESIRVVGRWSRGSPNRRACAVDSDCEIRRRLGFRPGFRLGCRLRF